MRLLTLTCVIGLCVGSGAAFAADLPLRSAPPAFIPPPLFTWTGGYFGVNAGYAFSNDTRVDTFNGLGTATGVPLTRPGSVRLSSDGVTAGAQIGYNYQFGVGSGVVVGIEADAAYTDLDDTRTFTVNGAPSTFRSGLDYLGTVRGRLGYAFNTFLLYGTGGFAYGGEFSRAGFVSPGGTLLYSGANNSMRTGFAYGGGIEYALPTGSFLNFFHSSAVTLKAEYLHYDLGSANIAVAATGAGGTSGGYRARFEESGDLARVGLNYKF